MDNPLTKYVGQKLNVIDGAYCKQGTSKDGNPYTYFEIQFINGFSLRLYPKNAEQFAIINAIELSQVNKHMEVAF